MAKFVSHKNPVSVRALKRKEIGTVAFHHSCYEDVKFTRVSGGWCRERTDFTGLRPTVVSSADVAKECNHAFGCKDSWARVY